MTLDALDHAIRDCRRTPKHRGARQYLLEILRTRTAHRITVVRRRILIETATPGIWALLASWDRLETGTEAPADAARELLDRITLHS